MSGAISEVQKINMGKGLFQKWPNVLKGKTKGLPVNAVHLNRVAADKRRKAEIQARQAKKQENARLAEVAKNNRKAVKSIHSSGSIERAMTLDTLRQYTVKDLRDLAKKAKIAGTSHLKKDALVAVLAEHLGL